MKVLLFLALAANICLASKKKPSSPFDFLDTTRPVIQMGEQKPRVDQEQSDVSFVQAGLVTTFTSKFFEDYSIQILDVFQKKMNGLKINDFCNEYAVGEFLTTNLCIKNQNLKEFSMNRDNSKVAINPESGSLSMQVDNMTLEFSLEFSLKSKPEWLNDSGNGLIVVKNTGITLQLTPSTNGEGLLQVGFSEVNIDLAHHEVQLDGSSDLSKGIEIILKNFKSFFKKELAQMLSWRLAKSVEESMNSFLLSGGGLVEILGTKGAFMNTTLTGDPVFHADYMSLPIDGSILQSNNGGGASSVVPIQRSSQFPQMPTFAKSENETFAGIQIQVFISEFTLNTALESFHNAGLIQLSQKVSSTYLKTFFPNFEEVFGHHEQVKIILQSESAPVIEINAGTSKITSSAEIRILNPYMEAYEAVKIQCQLNTVVEFELLHDFTVVGLISNMTLSVTDMEIYFLSNVDIKQIDTQAQSLASPFAKIANTQLSTGFTLPIPRAVNGDLSKTRLFNYDKYLMIESDPDVEHRVTEKVSELFDQAEGLLTKALQ